MLRCAVQISAEEAQRMLKDMVFAKWLAQGCEERTDTLKMVGREGRGGQRTQGAKGVAWGGCCWGERSTAVWLLERLAVVGS